MLPELTDAVDQVPQQTISMMKMKHMTMEFIPSDINLVMHNKKTNKIIRKKQREKAR